eukprot:evm.model.scf_1543.2 EVM.evm.TU.scf_1543.2   scf_1543:2610-4826(+)
MALDKVHSGDNVTESLSVLTEEQDGSEEMSLDDIEGGDIIDDINEEAAAASRAAIAAAQAEEGISTTVKTGFVCHTCPEALLKHTSAVPAALFKATLPSSLCFDLAATFRLVWKLLTEGTASAAHTLQKKCGLALRTSWRTKYWEQRHGQPASFVSVSPLECGILAGRKDVVETVLDCCEEWNRLWRQQAAERCFSDNKATEMPHPADAADGSGNVMNGHHSSGRMPLAVNIVRSLSLDPLIVMDGVEILSVLVERTGTAVGWNDSAFVRELWKKGLMQNETLLHRAAFFGAERIMKWILNGGGEAAFRVFFQRSQNSQAAQQAKRLAEKMKLSTCESAKDVGDPAVRLSTLFCGSIDMEDCWSRSPFHYAVVADRPAIIQLLFEELRSRGHTELALQVLNKPRIVDPKKPHWLSNSGTNAVQSSILMSRVECMNTLLNLGVDLFPKDGKADRGWNLLAFAICSKSEGTKDLGPTVVVKALLANARMTPEVAENMAMEQMGSAEVTPLMLAVSGMFQDIVELLAQQLPCGTLTKQAADGSTALHIAVRKRGWRSAKALLGGDTSLVNERRSQTEIQVTTRMEDHAGLTPLDIGMNVMADACKERACQGKKETRPKDAGKPCSPSPVTKICTELRRWNASADRKRPDFREVQAALLQSTEQVLSTLELQHFTADRNGGVRSVLDLVDYGNEDLNNGMRPKRSQVLSRTTPTFPQRSAAAAGTTVLIKGTVVRDAADCAK